MSAAARGNTASSKASHQRRNVPETPACALSDNPQQAVADVAANSPARKLGKKLGEAQLPEDATSAADAQGGAAAKPKRKRAPKAPAAASKGGDGPGADAPSYKEEPIGDKPKHVAKKPRAKKVEWPPGPLYDAATMRPPKCDAPKFHVISWNVAGLRALLKKDAGALAQLVAREAPDVVCLQETKLQDCHVADVEATTNLPGWHHHWHCSTVVKGYSGTAIISRQTPIGVVAGVGDECDDLEGRVLTAEFPDCFVVNVYTPNSGEGLKRLKYRTEVWDVAFARHIATLRRSSKPVILAGDFNCAHKAIDIANPKTNLRSAGFTEEERGSFTELYTGDGWVDVFRQQHPEPVVAYTYFSYRFNMRVKGKGWRLDYFLLSSQLAGHVHDAYHLKDVTGSDHVPLGVILRDWTNEKS